MRRVRCVRAHEEGRSVVSDPVRELADPAVQRIEENQAAYARSDAAPVEDRQGRSKSAAVGNNDDRHPGERECTARIAVQASLTAASSRKRLKPFGSQNFPA